MRCEAAAMGTAAFAVVVRPRPNRAPRPGQEPAAAISKVAAAARAKAAAAANVQNGGCCAPVSKGYVLAGAEISARLVAAAEPALP